MQFVQKTSNLTARSIDKISQGAETSTELLINSRFVCAYKQYVRVSFGKCHSLTFNMQKGVLLFFLKLMISKKKKKNQPYPHSSPNPTGPLEV